MLSTRKTTKISSITMKLSDNIPLHLSQFPLKNIIPYIFTTIQGQIYKNFSQLISRIVLQRGHVHMDLIWEKINEKVTIHFEDKQDIFQSTAFSINMTRDV